MIDVIGQTPLFFLQSGTLLSNPFVLEVVLPFVLVFTLVFALLQKSAILGKGKRQIDALVGLVIALIVISFANAVGIILSLIPFLVISLFILLVFMILYSMAFQGKEEFALHRGIKIVIGVVVTIALVIAILVATGGWNYLRVNLFSSSASSSLSSNLMLIGAIVIALIVALVGGGKSEKKD